MILCKNLDSKNVSLFLLLLLSHFSFISSAAGNPKSCGDLVKRLRILQGNPPLDAAVSHQAVVHAWAESVQNLPLADIAQILQVGRDGRWQEMFKLPEKSHQQFRSISQNLSEILETATHLPEATHGLLTDQLLQTGTHLFRLKAFAAQEAGDWPISNIEFDPPPIGRSIGISPDGRMFVFSSHTSLHSDHQRIHVAKLDDRAHMKHLEVPESYRTSSGEGSGGMAWSLDNIQFSGDGKFITAQEGFQENYFEVWDSSTLKYLGFIGLDELSPDGRARFSDLGIVSIPNSRLALLTTISEKDDLTRPRISTSGGLPSIEYPVITTVTIYKIDFQNDFLASKRPKWVDAPRYLEVSKKEPLLATKLEGPHKPIDISINSTQTLAAMLASNGSLQLLKINGEKVNPIDFTWPQEIGNPLGVQFLSEPNTLLVIGTKGIQKISMERELVSYKALQKFEAEFLPLVGTKFPIQDSADLLLSKLHTRDGRFLILGTHSGKLIRINLENLEIKTVDMSSQAIQHQHFGPLNGFPSGIIRVVEKPDGGLISASSNDGSIIAHSPTTIQKAKSAENQKREGSVLTWVSRFEKGRTDPSFTAELSAAIQDLNKMTSPKNLEDWLNIISDLGPEWKKLVSDHQKSKALIRFSDEGSRARFADFKAQFNSSPATEIVFQRGPRLRSHIMFEIVHELRHATKSRAMVLEFKKLSPDKTMPDEEIATGFKELLIASESYAIETEIKLADALSDRNIELPPYFKKDSELLTAYRDNGINGIRQYINLHLYDPQFVSLRVQIESQQGEYIRWLRSSAE